MMTVHSGISRRGICRRLLLLRPRWLLPPLPVLLANNAVASALPWCRNPDEHGIQSDYEKLKLEQRASGGGQTRGPSVELRFPTSRISSYYLRVLRRDTGRLRSRMTLLLLLRMGVEDHGHHSRRRAPPATAKLTPSIPVAAEFPQHSALNHTLPHRCRASVDMASIWQTATLRG